MKIIAMPRAAGKTTRMLDWLIEDPHDETRVLVVADRRQADGLLDQVNGPDWRGKPSDALMVKPWQIIPAYKFSHGLSLAGIVPRSGGIVLGIDNLEMVLPVLMGATVGPATTSAEVETPEAWRVKG